MLKSQIDEIEDGLDDIMSRRIVMGDHHFSLIVKAKSQRALNDNIALARTALSGAAIVSAREDLALAAAFWSQLPANFRYRPRIAAINSKNLAGFMPLHNFPAGRNMETLGRRPDPLTNRAGTPYYFRFHAADPNDPEGGSKRDVGIRLYLPKW